MGLPLLAALLAGALGRAVVRDHIPLKDARSGSADGRRRFEPVSEALGQKSAPIDHGRSSPVAVLSKDLDGGQGMGPSENQLGLSGFSQLGQVVGEDREPNASKPAKKERTTKVSRILPSGR
jgi:hypothetical protein